MSGPLATFPCPWCGMSYPLRPVLIGKAVRCKDCRNAFVLQNDGIATKVTPEVALQPAPVPAAPAPAITEDDVVLPTTAEARPALPSPNRAAIERNPKRKSERLEAARAQMAAELSAAASKAAGTETAMREERNSARPQKAAVASPQPPGEGKQRSRKAILTGEGERRQRELILWWSGSGAVMLGIVVLVYLFSLRSDVRQALDAYTAAVPTTEIRYPKLGNTIRSRAWLTAAPSMPNGPLLALNLDDASFQSERVIEISAIKQVLAEVAGLRLDHKHGLWVAAADAARLVDTIGDLSGSAAVNRAKLAKIRVVAHDDWVQRLALSDEDVRLLLDLIMGVPTAGVDFTKLLDPAQAPEALRLRPFRGRTGDLRKDIGHPPYIQVTGQYIGTMMRCVGTDWPPSWRLLFLRLPD